MKQFNSLSEPMKIAVIGAVATIIAAIIGSVIAGLFLLKSTAPMQPTPSSTSMSSPVTVTSVTPASATPTPSPTIAPTAMPDPAAATPQPGPNKSFTCTSGSLCTTYSMTIVITSVVNAGIGSSTWNFKITNTGTQPIDAYMYASIDSNEFHVYVGEVQIPPNGMQAVPATFPAYAPTAGMLQNPQLKFEILPQASTVVHYSETCTYQAGQNMCQ